MINAQAVYNTIATAIKSIDGSHLENEDLAHSIARVFAWQVKNLPAGAKKYLFLEDYEALIVDSDGYRLLDGKEVK